MLSNDVISIVVIHYNKIDVRINISRIAQALACSRVAVVGGFPWKRIVVERGHQAAWRQ